MTIIWRLVVVIMRAHRIFRKEFFLQGGLLLQVWELHFLQSFPPAMLSGCMAFLNGRVRQRSRRNRASSRLGRGSALLGKRLSPSALPGKRLSPSLFAPPLLPPPLKAPTLAIQAPTVPLNPWERLSPSIPGTPLTPEQSWSTALDPWEFVSECDPSSPGRLLPVGVVPPPPPVKATQLFEWSKPTPYDLWLHRRENERELARISEWPLKWILDEIHRLHMENASILAIPVCQPLVSRIPPRAHYDIWIKGKGKGKTKVCVPIPDERVCICDGDRRKINCDDPRCPLPRHGDDWSAKAVVENKQWHLRSNRCRVAILMEFARRETEVIPAQTWGYSENQPPTHHV